MKILCFISFLLVSSFSFSQEPVDNVQDADDQTAASEPLDETAALESSEQAVTQESSETALAKEQPLLFAACIDGNIEQIKSAIKTGADVNAEENGVSPLMFAVYVGKVDVIKVFIDAGADVNFKNADGVSPILIAAYMGDSSVTELLLNSGVHPEDKGVAAHIASMRENSEAAKVLQPSYNPLDYRKLRRNEYKTGDDFNVFFKVSRVYVDKDGVYRASCLLMPNKTALPNTNYEFFIESKNRFIFIEGDSIEANISYISLQSIVMSEMPYRAVEQALFKLSKIIDIW